MPLPVSRFAQILGPASAVELFQTVRIPLAAFGVQPATFKVRGVRFVFDRSAKGAIYLAHVRVSALSVPLAVEPEDLTPASLDSLVIPRPLVRRALPEPSTAEVEGVRRPSHNWSDKLPTGSRRNVEIYVRAEDSFPVQDQLPTLVMSGRKFSVSRYADTGLSTLVFSLTPEEFAELPERGPMHIQYGRTRIARLWRLPDYEKSKLGR